MKVFLTIFLSVLVCFNSFSLRKFETETETEGAFFRTCRNVAVNNNLLSAECQNMNQQWTSTTLDLNTCIANINGNLQQAVNGNFGASSNSCRISGNNLICSATTMAQTQNSNAYINIDSFISNLDGNLSCDNNPRRNTSAPAVHVAEAPAPVRTPERPAPTRPAPTRPAPTRPRRSPKTKTRRVKKTNFPDHIHSTGNVLRETKRLRSKNRKSFLIMQADGNLVLYSKTTKNGVKANFPSWASNTAGKGKGPYRAVLSKKGNLSVVDSTKRKLWSTNTAGRGVGPYSIVVQNDGNFVLYDSNGAPIWASKTYLKYN